MKPLLSLGALLLVAVSSRADFVIEQQLESSLINGKLTYEIKGDNARIEMPSPAGGNVTTIIKGETGEMIMLMDAQKMAMTMSLKDIQKQTEAAQQAAGAAMDALKPKPTGEKEKIGQWNTDIYETNAGETKVKMWVAKDYPNAKAIKDAMAKASKSMAGSGMDLTKFDLPGMTLKTEAVTALGKMTTTLVSVKETTVPASDFTVPEGYQMQKAPGFGGQ